MDWRGFLRCLNSVELRDLSFAVRENETRVAKSEFQKLVESGVEPTDEERRFLRIGRKLLAIRSVKNRMGVGLKVAKNLVFAWADELNKERIDHETKRVSDAYYFNGGGACLCLTLAVAFGKTMFWLTGHDSVGCRVEQSVEIAECPDEIDLHYWPAEEVAKLFEEKTSLNQLVRSLGFTILI